VIFRIYGALHGPSASAELLVSFVKVIRELLDEFDIDNDIWETSLNERLWHVCIFAL